MANTEMNISTARHYQAIDSRLMATWGRGIFRHKPGLGKTYMMLMTWNYLVQDGKCTDKVIIIASKSALSVWIRELKRWMDIEPIYIQGTAPDKKDLFAKMVTSSKGVYLISYDTLRSLGQGSAAGFLEADVLFMDELHRIRNRKTKAFEVVSRIRATYVFGATATWATRGAQDLWTGLHLLNRKFFSSYWKFVNTYCQVVDGMFGKEIVGVRNAEALKKLLSMYSIARTYEEVVQDVPQQVRAKIDIDMTPDQRKLYMSMQQEMVAEAGDAIIISPNVLSRQTNLRLLSICPRMLHPEYPLGGMVEYLIDALEDDPYTVIFCPFKKLFPIIREELAKKGINNVFQLVGGMEPDDVTQTVNLWKQTQGVIMCTIQFAQSFDLDTTNTAYFAGFSYVPDDNFQAEGRLTRLTTTRKGPLIVNYLLTKDSVDYDVKDIVDGKIINISRFLHEYIEQARKSTRK